MDTITTPRPARQLLERDVHLSRLHACVEAAVAGRSRVALVSGPAGIGKTSLVRELRDAVGRHRVLAGGCDDLRTPRTLGPLRDAARGTGGALEAALAAGEAGDAVYDAAVAELAGREATVLVVEDVHWADDATLDLLRHVVRRLDAVRAVLVLTYRDESLSISHPLRPLLAAAGSGPVERLTLEPLSLTAVEALAAGTGRDPAEVLALTGGNPFYVTEVLAADGDGVPASVVDAVLSRVQRLDPSSVAVLEQLSVMTAAADGDVARALVGDRPGALAEAEASGVVELAATGVAFRHELARRAVEGSLTEARRRELNAAVVHALFSAGEPDPDRLVHHAAEAADVATVLGHAPSAGRQAARAGAHRQALAHFEAALPYAERLPVGDRAALLDDYAWELHIAHRFHEAVRAGRQAVELRERVGDPVLLGGTLLRLSRQLYTAGDTGAAQAAVEWAVRIAEATGYPPLYASAACERGTMLALTGASGDAVDVLGAARRLAVDAGRGDLAALCLNYRGIARCDLGDTGGLDDLRESLAAATANGAHECAARAYTNLAELLYRYGRWDELDACLRRGIGYVGERGFWSHGYNLQVHRALLLLRRGDWDGAERLLRPKVDDPDDPGMLYVYSVPPLARLLARRGDPAAEELLAAAWERAVRHRSLIGLAYAGTAYVEWAWLVGRPAVAAGVRDAVARRWPRGAGLLRGELERYLARAGVGGGAYDGCPEPYAAGLRGDWRSAAAGWERLGDRYEQALELAESGQVEPTLSALRLLDELDAVPAAALVRRRLSELGVTGIPRRARAATRGHPAGLTERQADVLTLLTDGLTNAEIADRLVVSVRTVDHHVSAILGKLGVATRREAAAAARSRGLVTGFDVPRAASRARSLVPRQPSVGMGSSPR
ncbi:ATP-binding protein [Jiangella asiatica]|uniref:ATP-binding protein n=1 Tax=Jiangella asiatica TaxID=2530372 RepID=UPI0013A5E497|nr:AAA family ATPase [Jiangella asiatica]